MRTILICFDLLLLHLTTAQDTTLTTDIPNNATLSEEVGASDLDDRADWSLETLVRHCEEWEFPEDSFKAQPDDSKVYYKIDKIEEGPFVEHDLVKLVSAFGVRVVGESTIENEKLLHVANLLAKVLDLDSDGKPDNKELVEELLTFHPVLFLLPSADKIMLLMDPQRTEEGFPFELKFCPFAFDFEEVKKINPSGKPGDATCEGENAKGKENNDRTLAFILDHIMGRGFGKVMPQDARAKLDEIYDLSIKAKTFDPVKTNCPPNSDECGKVMYASWGLSTMLGFDTCWCEKADALKFCDAESFRKEENALVDLLLPLFPGIEDLTNDRYDPKDKGVLVE